MIKKFCDICGNEIGGGMQLMAMGEPYISFYRYLVSENEADQLDVCRHCMREFKEWQEIKRAENDTSD